MRSIFANEAGAPCTLNPIWSRSGLREVTLQAPLRLNGALNSSWRRLETPPEGDARSLEVSVACLGGHRRRVDWSL
jgi:hypothetical protein